MTIKDKYGVAKQASKREIARVSRSLACDRPDIHILQYPDYFYRQELRNEYAEFIKNLCAWDWFCTMTWQSLVHPESALKLFHMFVHKLNKRVYGNRYYLKEGLGVFCCIAIEMQLRQVLHIHSLVAGVSRNISFTEFAQWWQNRAGSCNIDAYDSNRDAGQYLSKYVAKSSEIEFYGNTKQVTACEVPELLFR